MWKFIAEDNYKRYAVHLLSENLTERSEIECTVRMYKHKRTKTVSENGKLSYFVTKWGLPKSERLKKRLCAAVLNIRYGNGVFIVVRVR